MRTRGLTIQWPIQGGARGPGPPPFENPKNDKEGPPCWKSPKKQKGAPFLKSPKCKRAPLTKNVWHYPPPPLKRAGVWWSRKHSATTPPPPTESRRRLEIREKFCYYPPPTESRRPAGTSHERGPLRKILDLWLLSAPVNKTGVLLVNKWRP